ncbi:Uncharacterised protein [Clostridioides difficile]|nr:hypothetical protein [Clostridioides difficile]CCL32223.1 membrane hypothetical protein [Clostridioides difficile E15]EGT3944125.1 hypothetical protein [Clostridioides difficile]MBG0198850.1 hypothetical protein [Clostridioides difficile]MBH7167690.1 hypothetical protein [Clostridioides difficile]
MLDFFYRNINTLNIILSTALYLLNGYGLYMLSLRANIKRPWLAFVPILNILPLIKLARVPNCVFFICILLMAINIFFISVPLLLISTIISLSLSLYVMYKFLLNYNCSNIELVLLMLFASLTFDSGFTYLYILIREYPYSPKLKEDN